MKTFSNQLISRVFVLGLLLCSRLALANDSQLGSKARALQTDAGLVHETHGAAQGQATAAPGHQRSRPLTPSQIGMRSSRIAQLRDTMGRDFLQREEVKAEFNVHAWRIARLRRARALVAQQNNVALVNKATGLIATEVERHKQRLKQLRAGQGQPDAGAQTTTLATTHAADVAHNKAINTP